MSSRDRDRYKSHYSRDRDRERDRSRERDRHAGSERYDSSSRRSEHKDRRDRNKHSERESHRERDKDRDRRRSGRDKSRSRSRSRSRDRSKHRDRKSGESSRRQSQQDTQQQQPPAQQQQQQSANGLTADQQAEAHKKKREAEQNALDEEMEERRKRVEEWRQKRAVEAAAAAAAEQQRKQEEEAAAAAAAAAEAGANNKGWSLEDDEDDEEPQQQPGSEDNEPDPLDAFMEDNAAVAALPVKQEQQQQQQDVTMTDAAGPDTGQAPVKSEAAAAAAAADEEEPDPLDAFMATAVLPGLQRDRFNAPAAAAAAPKSEPAAGAAAVGDAAVPRGLKAAVRPGSSGGKRSSAASKGTKGKQQQRRRFYDTSSESDWTDSEEEGPAEEAELDDETWAKNVTAGKLSKGEKLLAVDHATVEYPPFRRRFYIEVPEIQRMTEEEVAAARKTEGIKVRGADIPKPVKTWTQCGINVKVLEVLKKHGFERPLSIQAQALPIIMSGRDCIGIAKTGSGKTLAFVLPMLRHIRDQAELRDGDGPIALIMAPTRELVQQIAKEVKRFGSPMMISCTPVFGGAGVANQISELKRGTEVVSATPGRLIDLLVSRVTNLRRVTYLVLDEADRMFDMGFEPQITRIVNNIRPDRQTVMFSATFPRAVETLARQILNNPVEIQVGGRSVVNADIAQFVEIRPEADRFLRLLEILGEWYEVGKIIIFVHTQDKCDNLFRDLLKAGYPCLSLHGGKEQSDRECTIGDFKGAVCNILVATSIAARGLDVRDLVLVVNYDVPNHHEDYVHRVGRTGRAGNKGTAITFIGPDEDRYAPDLVKALKESSATVPQDLQELAEVFASKKKQGLVQGHGSGYGGSGFKFDKAEDAKIKQARKSKAKEFGIVNNEEEEEAASEEDDDIRPSTQQQPAAAGGIVVTPATAAAVAAAINGPAATPAAAAAAAAAAALGGAPKFLPAQPGQHYPGQAVPQAPSALVAAATAAAALASGVPPPGPAAAPASSSLAAAQAAAMRAAALAAAYAQGGGAPAAPAVPVAAAAQQVRQPGFESEMEINDFVQNARWKVTHKGFQQEITDLTGAAVTTKGIYVAPGAQPPEGERKLYLLIEAPSEAMVRRAKQEIRRVIEELVEKAMRRDVGAGARRYQI